MTVPVLPTGDLEDIRLCQIVTFDPDLERLVVIAVVDPLVFGREALFPVKEASSTAYVSPR